MIAALMRLFPRSWRNRYEDEFRALLADTGLSAPTVLNVVAQAGAVRARHHRNGAMLLVAVATVVCAEIVAVSADYTDNILWVPRSLASGLLLGAVLIGAVVIMRPAAMRSARFVRAQVHR